MVMKRYEGKPAESPMLYSGTMVRAILDDIKTKTRRIANPQPSSIEVQHMEGGMVGVVWQDAKKRTYRAGTADADVLQTMINERCPYGRPGDRLWVRETFEFGFHPDTAEPVIFYPADGSTLELDWPSYSGRLPVAKKGKHVSIHMPRWASRLLLEIVSVGIERIQDITEEDAIAEGVRGRRGHYYIDAGPPFYRTAWAPFSLLWNSLNASRGFGWDKNPWVWVIEYRVISKTKIFDNKKEQTDDTQLAAEAHIPVARGVH